MQEELNTRLLQKISYLEKGAVLGMIVCSCFFLAAILYFVKANVYVILISGLKKKVAHVRNKIKRKRVRRIGGKGKNEITNKAYFKLIVLAFVGVGSIYTYRTYYVEAAVITQLAIDEDTEVMDNTAGDIGEKSPKLYLESKGWIGGTGEFAQYLFSKDNRTFTIGVEENTFHSDLEKESFLFQVSEKESGIDQEGFNKIRQYEQGEFERKDSDNPIYQKTLSFETEKNRQKVYSLYLEYINRWGMPLIGDKGAVENYGNILSGTFKSKKLVIDKKCPEIAGLKLEKADKKKEGIRFAKKSVSETYNTDEIYNTDKKCNTDITYNIDEECYYNTSVKGMIDIREKYLDLDSIHIQAMPLDDRAREVVKENEAESNDGMLDILAWTHTKKGNLHQISFDFAVEGKWKFILDCADLAGNKGVSNQTGQEGIESTDVTIDKSAPELSVDYKGIINVMEAESSPANINKKLKSNGEKITSSGNELFMKRENSIDICIEDMNLEAENIELKLYRVKYGLNGKIEQNKESWEEITEKIKQEPEKQELEKGEQEKNSKTVMRYSVTNLDDGHYKLMIHCTDKAGNVMTAEKSSETERCIYNGYYESPLYTVDTKSPLITSVILNQNAVKKIGKRQYFQNAPQITIKIQEENFNKINFSLEGKMFYSNGMVMEKEWERFKSQEKSLQWKSYYEDGIRINETNIQVEAEGNYTLNFGVIDSAACVANQENLKITYDCHKPEIIYRKRQQIELEADKFSQSDADNPLTIQADLEDNAGHTEKNILNEKVVIDNTKPEIEVVYNQNNQTQYYNFSRKATVTVKEKNFSPDLVVWNIQGSNQKYQIGEWKNVQGTYVCEISFEEDGRDYSVGLSVTDKAGNKSEWKDRNYFTIDKTVPQISIQINGIGKQADQVPYFNTERIITFCIQEQNFDKDKVEYNIDAIHGKSRITIKKPVKYQEDGDKYYSRLVLRKEAKYHIQVKCTDKAGNVSETAETKEFIIDTTTPAVHIAGVKQNGIYQGKKIMPQVICKDQYLDRESVEISLKKIDDRNVLKKEWSYERAESENTVQVQWDNIKKTENSDGIYYLQIKGQDKAGNKIKDDFKVVFRVNQRGADFILSHALKKKINKYYLKEAPKIKLREQCVKQTKSRAVILKDNEERKVIGESSITSSVIADKKSERYGWYEKYYNFAKKDFEREGDYRVTFQADTKEKELRFVVDKTPPVVHIGNLDKQIYEEKEHEFTIRVMDNYAFKELELYMETDRNILGQKGTKKIIIKPKDLDENYMVRKTLTADKRYQTVRYIARDKAGNVIDSNDNGDTKVCLVTDSKTVKEYQEHKKEYMLIGIISTLGIFIVISGSGLFIFTRRKRNLK